MQSVQRVLHKTCWCNENPPQSVEANLCDTALRIFQVVTTVGMNSCFVLLAVRGEMLSVHQMCREPRKDHEAAMLNLPEEMAASTL